MWITGGLLWCFYQLFDSHSDGTHSLQRIHWWASDVMLNFSKSVLIKKQTHLHIEWPKRVNFQHFVIFEWAVPLKNGYLLSCKIQKSLRNWSTASCCLSLYQQNSTREPERRTSSGENSTMMGNTHDTLTTATMSEHEHMQCLRKWITVVWGILSWHNIIIQNI